MEDLPGCLWYLFKYVLRPTFYIFAALFGGKQRAASKDQDFSYDEARDIARAALVIVAIVLAILGPVAVARVLKDRGVLDVPAKTAAPPELADPTGKEPGQATVELRGAALMGADLRGHSLEGADLRGVSLRKADLREANLRRASLQGADLRESDLRNANLSQAVLEMAQLGQTNLSNATMIGAVLTSASLRGANLGGADLRLAKLQDADLRGANLLGAHLAGADLSGVRYSASTTWPEGARAPAGAVKVED